MGDKKINTVQNKSVCAVFFCAPGRADNVIDDKKIPFVPRIDRLPQNTCKKLKILYISDKKLYKGVLFMLRRISKKSRAYLHSGFVVCADCPVLRYARRCFGVSNLR